MAVWGSLISAAGGLLNTAFGQLFGRSNADYQQSLQKELMDKAQEQGFENMRYQQKLNRDSFDYQFEREADMNSMLMHNSPSIQKQAMVSAGINPASNFGNFSGNVVQPSAPTFTPQSGSPSAPSVRGENVNLGSLLADLVNIPVKKAQVDVLKEDARKKRLENDETEEKNKVAQSYQNMFVPETDKDGNLVWKVDVDNENLPDIGKFPLKTKGGIEDLRYSWNEFLKKTAEYNRDISQAQLEAKVNEGKLKSTPVIKALINMPNIEYEKLRTEWFNLIKEGTLKDLQMEFDRKRNEIQLTEQKMKELEYRVRDQTSIVKILDRFGDGSWSWKDIIVGLFMAFTTAKM